MAREYLQQLGLCLVMHGRRIQMGLFSTAQSASIRAAVREEAKAAKARTNSLTLEIDAIEHVRAVPNGHIYRLLLSRQIQLSVDQPLTFVLKGGETIACVVISCSDEGLIVLAETELP